MVAKNEVPAVRTTYIPRGKLLPGPFSTFPPATTSLLFRPHNAEMATNKAEGRREDALAKQRDQMREEFERQKKNLINETEKARPSSNRFVGQHDSMEDNLKHSTVGLVHLEEFQQKRKALEEAKAREAARTNELKYVFPPIHPYCNRMAHRSWRTCLETTPRKRRKERKLPRLRCLSLWMMKKGRVKILEQTRDSHRRMTKKMDRRRSAANLERILPLTPRSYQTETGKRLRGKNARGCGRSG